MGTFGSPYRENSFFSDLKYFVSNLNSGQKFFLKCLNNAWIFFEYFISNPNSDHKLAKPRLFLARKKSRGGSRTPYLLIAGYWLYQLGYSHCYSSLVLGE